MLLQLAPLALVLLVAGVSCAPSNNARAAEPVTINLEAREVPRDLSATGLRRRALPVKNLPLKDYFNGTDLQ